MNPAGVGQKSTKTTKGGQTDAASSQNLLQIGAIRNRILVMRDGSFRMVIYCRAINFDLMNPAEKESVEYAYQGFLNSLYFPIQVLIRSRRVNVEDYIEKLANAAQHQTNMLLGLAMADYLDFVTNLVDNTDIMEKSFYVVVPYSGAEGVKENVVKHAQGFFNKLFSFGSKQANPVVIDSLSFQKAESELSRRCQTVIEGLNGVGVAGAVLATEDLIELFYESYNPEAAGLGRIDSSQDITNPVVTRASPAPLTADARQGPILPAPQSRQSQPDRS